MVALGWLDLVFLLKAEGINVTVEGKTNNSLLSFGLSHMTVGMVGYTLMASKLLAILALCALLKLRVC